MLHFSFRCIRRRFVRIDGLQREISTIPQPQRLAGKVALITGAASGLGRATAAAFIGHGAAVVLADIQHAAGAATAASLGPNATFVPCDVTVEADIAAAVDRAVALHGHLDVLHNNAGVAGSMAPLVTELSLADFDRTMAVNVRSVVAGIKHAARVMIPRRAGCILCTGSITGIVGGLAAVDYSVSKSAVAGAVRAAAAELGRHGVRVNCISPQAVATPFGVRAMVEMVPGLREERAVEMMREAVAAGSGLKGMVCEAEDVAAAAVFLASDEARYVTGHDLVVDGGFTTFKTLHFPPP